MSFGGRSMTKRLVIVAGNIGVGKTSLAERISERMGWRCAYESVAGNTYLADFYNDMHEWSFHLQIFFLGHRAKQYLDLSNETQSVIFDRTIYEDFYIFARALYHLGNVDERDYLSYQRVFNLVTSQLPPPDLLIYLKAPVSVLMKRIHSRARSIETGINSDYLTLLETFYDDGLKNDAVCPGLTISSDDLDCVHKPQHLDVVVERILDRLAGKEELEFPAG